MPDVAESERSEVLGPQQMRSLRQSKVRVNIFEGAIRSGKTIVSLLRSLMAVRRAGRSSSSPEPATPRTGTGLFANNMLWVGLGNLVGGAIVVGLGYWIVGGRPRVASLSDTHTPETVDAAG